MAQDLASPENVNRLREGIIAPAALALLRHAEKEVLHTTLNRIGIKVDEATLKRILERLEEMGFLVKDRITEESPLGAYYRTTEAGERAVRVMFEDWHRLEDATKRLAASG